MKRANPEDVQTCMLLRRLPPLVVTIELRQSRLEVFLEVLDIFQSDRETDHAVGDAEPRALLGADAEMSGGGGMGGQGFRSRRDCSTP